MREPQKSMMLLCLLATICATSHSAIAGDAYLPKDDSTVLEKIPAGLFESASVLAKLRKEHAKNRANVENAVALASEYLNLGTATGDPRYFGYAQSTLATWWESEDAPAAVLGLRAELKERDHRYDDAIVDLKRLLQLEPQNSQAWIELSNIYRIQGKYELATQACDELARFSGTLSTTICRTPLMAVTGKAQEAYTSLERIPDTIKDKHPGIYTWLLSMRAELARTLGRNELAEQQFRKSLLHNPNNKFVLRAFADLLLDTDRADEALSLTRNHASDNGLLLRAAIAAKRGNEPKLATRLANQLATRFEEIRLRGSEPHGRFESRFAMELEDDPQKSLELAVANWKKQKEARDSRNLLQAAVAADDWEAAEPVIQFLESHGADDVVLKQLIREAKAKQ
jgi:tetratricopeptide (TPR) repeat protein